MTRASLKTKTPWGRAALILFFCTGIAFLGLLTDGEYPTATARQGGDPMAGYFGQDMPRYPGTQELPAGPNSLVGGTRVRMSTFSTDDDPVRVARFYQHFWQARQLFVTSDVTHMGGVVSAVDTSGGRVYQALIVVQGGRTVVFPSLTEAPLRADAPTAGPAVVPLFPGSSAVIHLGADEGTSAARIVLSMNDGTLAENLAHYERELRAAGYEREVHKQPDELGPLHRVLVFRKEGSEVTVNLTSLGEKRTRVHLMEVGS